jgi:tRNA(Ile)-lysidine synthase
MLKIVREFLAKHWDGRHPLLLGYSGGPDSKALLYALLEARCSCLHLAHVDHGWRKESRKEASELEKEAEGLGLPFHTIQLNLPRAANKEAASRKARLAFFQSLFAKFPFQALLLAHQAGDAAETALKRVLEGAHLPFLGGMESVGELEGMNVWRPFLSVKKEDILKFLSLKNLTPLIDPTNADPVYMRARMRIEILPLLARTFGKEISDNLFLLASRASELKAYLEKKTETHDAKRGPWGLFGYIGNMERIEARYLLQKWGEIEKIKLSRDLLERALDAAASNLPNRRIASRVFADRGYVFLLAAALPSWGTSPLRLAPGSWVWGDWTIEVREGGSFFEESGGWKEVWSGRFTVGVPRGWLTLPPSGPRLRRLWNEKKIPAFFRSLVPIVSNEKGVMLEFLTGKNLPEIEPYFKLVVSNHSLPTL